MSELSAQQFLDRLTDDLDFRQQFKSLPSADMVIQEAKKEGYDFTVDELQRVVRHGQGVARHPQDQLKATDSPELMSSGEANLDQLTHTMGSIVMIINPNA